MYGLNAQPPGGIYTQPGAASRLPRGYRNNNPLNIEAGRFTQGVPGFMGSDGRFARFENLDQGVNAASSLLDVYNKKHGIDTVAGIINRWAPASDGNNVSAYANNVAKKLGVNPGDPIDLNDPNIKQTIIKAMAEHENGAPMPANGVQLAQAPQGQTRSDAVAPGFMNPATGTVELMPAAQSTQNPWNNIGSTIAGIGAGLTSIVNPQAAAVQASIAENIRKRDDGKFTTQVDATNGIIYRVDNRTGAVSATRTSMGRSAAPTADWDFKVSESGEIVQQNKRTGEIRREGNVGVKQKEMPESAMKHISERFGGVAAVDDINKQAERFISDIDGGRLDLGLYKNWLSAGKNLMGISDEQSRSFADFEQFRQLLASERLRENKGVQTEGDALREMRNFVGGFANYDNDTARDALLKLIDRGDDSIKRSRTFIDSYKKRYGEDILAPWEQEQKAREDYYSGVRERVKRPQAVTPTFTTPPPAPTGAPPAAPGQRPPLSTFMR